MVRMLPALGFGMLLLATPARAGILTVNLNFTEPGWGGIVRSDDTTGQTWDTGAPIGPLPGWTAYAITDMTITAIAGGVVHTWTEDDIFGGSGGGAPPSEGW